MASTGRARDIQACPPSPAPSPAPHGVAPGSSPSREETGAMLVDADVLASLIPGFHGVQKLSETHFVADVTLGVGPVKGRYKAEVRLCSCLMLAVQAQACDI